MEWDAIVIGVVGALVTAMVALLPVLAQYRKAKAEVVKTQQEYINDQMRSMVEQHRSEAEVWRTQYQKLSDDMAGLMTKFIACNGENAVLKVRLQDAQERIDEQEKLIQQGAGQQ